MSRDRRVTISLALKRFLPPAPYVTEMKSGWTANSLSIIFQNFGVFSARLGGMTSKETVVCTRLGSRLVEGADATGAVEDGWVIIEKKGLFTS